MKKPSNRKERINFICRKKGSRIADMFVFMTDKEVKQYFEAIWPFINDMPDVTEVDDTAQCIRCGCNVELHFECLCGYDRAVFDEDDWKQDLSLHGWSELRGVDEEFVANGYKKESKK